MASYDSRQCRAKQLHLRKSCSKMRDMLRHYGPTKKQSNQISVVVGGSFQVIILYVLYLKITVNLNSLLSGWGWPSPPVLLHGPVGPVSASLGCIFTPVGGQNQPFTMFGFKSFRSHPSKLHFRPEVHVNLWLPVISFCFKNSISSGVSKLEMDKYTYMLCWLFPKRFKLTFPSIFDWSFYLRILGPYNVFCKCFVRLTNWQSGSLFSDAPRKRNNRGLEI